jgi:3-deoxy-D-manno-octulosonic-acid transferase
LTHINILSLILRFLSALFAWMKNIQSGDYLKEKLRVYILYQGLSCILFLFIFPFFLFFSLVTGKHQDRLGQRLGTYPELPMKNPGTVRLWLHASSVGEVQAARALIPAIRDLLPDAEFVLSTMTAHGRQQAENFLGTDVTCVLAPLDVPLIVDRARSAIDPDLYVCIETEIWPLILKKIADSGCPLVLVNGRMSSGSYQSYRKVRGFMAGILSLFERAALISSSDYERYVALGLDGEQSQVLGNVKYDMALPQDSENVRDRYRSILGITEDSELVIAGSTHGNEEEQLLALIDAEHTGSERLLIIAPRHLERILKLQKMLEGKQQPFDLFSNLKKGQVRKSNLVLIDSMGELAALYSVAEYVFCGGSLVPRGGHNVMEAALWSRPVFYGPHMSDFKDATRMLEDVGAGFMVPDVQSLIDKINYYRNHQQEYRLACTNAGELARTQQGAAGQQAEMVVSVLHKI